MYVRRQSTKSTIALLFLRLIAACLQVDDLDWGTPMIFALILASSLYSVGGIAYGKQQQGGGGGDGASFSAFYSCKNGSQDPLFILFLHF